MNLTKKILLIILLICIVFSSLYYYLFRAILTAPIITEKNLQARRIMDNALTVLESEVQRILTITEDWAMWDSMYDYASSPNNGFVDDLAPYQTLVDAELSIFTVLDKSNNLLLCEGYNNSAKKKIIFSDLKNKKGALWNYLIQTQTLKDSASGIISTQHGPILVVSSPILRSNNLGPRNGRVLMGRLIDSTFQERISKQTGHQTLFLAHHPGMKTKNQTDSTGPRPRAASILVKESADIIHIYYPVQDINHQHAFTICIKTPKRIFKILDKAAHLFFVLLIAGFLLFGGLCYLLINHLVVRRVKMISEKTNTVFSFDDLSLRIPVTLNDEITLLSKNINTMLKRLQTENIKKEEIERMLVLNEKLIFLGKANAGIAHEINNPLFAIANSLQLIKKHLPPDNQRLNRIFTVVESEIKRVRTITSNMHKLSIRQLDKPVLSDLVTIMGAAINVVTWSNLLNNTVIDFKQKEADFPIYCNPDTLQQVFLNILINAIDAMAGEGKATVTITDEGDGYRIDFTDEGPGFSDHIKEDLFAPFQTTKYGKGSGLGLHISNNIIHNHGGTITLNEEYTEGAHLVVKIPKGGPYNESKTVDSTGR